MANIYEHAFNGTLDYRPFSGSNIANPPAQISGKFVVDYDIAYQGGSKIQSEIYVNGIKLDQASIIQSLNSNGALGTLISASGSQSVTSPFSSNLQFIYTGRTPSEFSNTSLQTTAFDYTNYAAGAPLVMYSSDRLAVTSTPVCFVAGTLIRTARGEVAVEDLIVGDLAVTASGTLRPINWIGNRALDAKGEALPHNEQPIRIRAGAFGPGLPARDLRLSHGHPVLVGADANGEGGVLVPVMCLINGTSVLREPATQVTYWHIELDAHDILLAEGLAAESYYDMGSRVWFAGEDGMLTDPDFVQAGAYGRCRPVAVDGALVDGERKRLDGVFAGSLSAQCEWNVSAAGALF